MVLAAIIIIFIRGLVVLALAVRFITDLFYVLHFNLTLLLAAFFL
jgi:hypothetical protein